MNLTDRQYFALKRAHSLTGVVPIGKSEPLAGPENNTTDDTLQLSVAVAGA